MMEEYKPFKSGKVRELYDLGDSLIMVCTDRISAFDNILESPIPKKGEVLNKMSKFWFDFTKDVVPNHMISINAADMPAFFQKPEFDGNSMKTQKLEMIPVECIVRGYITGSGWESYKKDGTICGIRLPEGLEECEKLPEAIFTPSTKAPVGEHDMNISMEEGEEWIERTFPGKGKEYMERLRDLTLALYRKCADYALSKGIIIADTKFEFGLDKEGNIVLGDEMLTPDNSRFWPLDGYAPGKGQPSYDKQFVRDYLKENPGDVLPQEIIDKTIGKYIEAYELLTGEKF
jgi:phosphoribosylaminoimidazole-succinocarboxamide synthase